MKKNELVILSDPKCGSAEAIRTLRTNLQFLLTKKANSIMITSSMPGEGKSFISSNLAASFSLLNYKVLLVDCDLRRGRQNKVFKVTQERGLSSLLIDEDMDYKKYLQKSAVKNLYIIPSGIVPPNPSELLQSEKFSEILNNMKNDFDLVLLDCPPVNPVTDALVVSSLCDRAVIVCAYKETPTDLLLNTKKTLENSGVKIAGVVINKMERSKNKYYYNKYYE